MTVNEESLRRGIEDAAKKNAGSRPRTFIDMETLPRQHKT